MLTCMSAFYITGKIKEILRQHLEVARIERMKFYKHGGKANMVKNRDPTKPWWKYGSVIIDGMTQWTTRLPHFRRTPSWLTRKELFPVHCMGSLIENTGRFMDFNYANYSDDANFLVNVLHRDILRIQEHRVRGDGAGNSYPMPEVLYVQLDNVSSNKSQRMIAYISWLVQQKVFRKVKVIFLIVGHTHENNDQMFSRFSVRLRRKEAWTLPEMMKVAEECFTDGVGVEHTTTVYNFGAWLDDLHDGIHMMKPQHQFKAFLDEEGFTVLQFKEFSTDLTWKPETPLRILRAEPATASPGFVEPVAMRKDQVEGIEKMIKSMSTHLNDDFKPEHQAFWDDVLEVQEHYLAGGACRDPQVPYVMPTVYRNEESRVLVEAIEEAAAVTARALAVQAAEFRLPQHLEERLNPFPRMMYTGKGRSEPRKRAAERYVLNPDFEVEFEQMDAGSLAVYLAPENETGKFSFRISLTRNTDSPPLYLVRVKAVDAKRKRLQLEYLALKMLTHKESRQVGIKLACKIDAFKTLPGVLPRWEAFSETDMLLSWNPEKDFEIKNIPQAQYEQLRVTIEAQNAKRQRTNDIASCEATS